MNNIAKHIMATVALAAGVFTFGMPVFAQDDGSTVQYAKRVSPKPDDNGVYTISLEAYVTGSVTVTENYYPADVFLLLDFSGSMTGSGGGSAANMPAMQNAVTDFIKTMQDKNQNVLEDSNGGYRVAIIPYSSSTYTNQNGCNALHDVDDYTATPQGATVGGTLIYNGRTVWPSTGSGTMSGDAMELAKNLISAQNTSGAYTDKDGKENSKRSKIVILFTDGVPGSRGANASYWVTMYNYNNYPDDGYDMTTEANQCISASSDIISDYNGVVYTVGLFTSTVTGNANQLSAVKTYMAYASSDYPDETAMPQYRSGLLASTYEGTYSIVVDNAGDLAGIFSSISSSVGGNYSASSSSSVLVDIVTQSFNIPKDTDLGTVKVFAVPCTQTSATAIIDFDDVKDTYQLETVTDPNNIPAGKVCLQVDSDTGEVTVTGFDYGANWCGWDGENNKAHGKKLVMQIPITVNEEAVGGPAVETNADGSKLIIKDSEGNTIGSYDFIKPVLKIPVSIWIEKHGLVDDDSAVFTLARAPYHSGASYDDYVNGAYKNSWENFTKVIVNEKNMQTVTVDGVEHKVVKISGLDPDYYYRIKEDAWAWGYPVQIGGVQYTIGDNLQNPLQVYNTPDPDAPKHAEAVVRNVFTERTTSWTATKEQ